MSQFTLGIVIPVWKRPQVTSLVLDYYRRMSIPGIRLLFLIVYSPEDPFHDQWKGYGGSNFLVHSFPNKPVSDKFNAGVALMVNSLSLDAVTVFGSDDFVNEEYIKTACRLVQEGHQHISASGLYFYSVDDDDIFYSTCENVGGCSILDSDTVKKIYKNNPYPIGRDAGVDMSFRRRSKDRGVSRFASIFVSPKSTATMLDIKWVGNNINGYNSLHKAFGHKVIKENPEDYFRRYFDVGLYEKLREIRYV